MAMGISDEERKKQIAANFMGHGLGDREAERAAEMYVALKAVKQLVQTNGRYLDDTAAVMFAMAVVR
jgi:hypothetical protein